MLFNTENSVVWESFHHPTDSLVVDQWLHDGMKLTASMSDSNLTEGLLSILPITHWFAHQIESNHPQLYYEFKSGGSNSNGEVFIFYNNGSLYLPTYDDAGNDLSSLYCYCSICSIHEGGGWWSFAGLSVERNYLEGGAWSSERK